MLAGFICDAHFLPLSHPSPARLYSVWPVPQPPTGKGDDLLFLQYTAGATGPPKGVMISHANLLAQLRGLLRTSKKFTGYSNNHTTVRPAQAMLFSQ